MVTPCGWHCQGGVGKTLCHRQRRNQNHSTRGLVLETLWAFFDGDSEKETVSVAVRAFVAVSVTVREPFRVSVSVSARVGVSVSARVSVSVTEVLSVTVPEPVCVPVMESTTLPVRVSAGVELKKAEHVKEEVFSGDAVSVTECEGEAEKVSAVAVRLSTLVAETVREPFSVSVGEAAMVPVREEAVADPVSVEVKGT
jgi:hypothetical protein